MQDRHAGRVMISYAHQSAAHKADVDRLCALLRANGVDAVSDLCASQEPQDWVLWMGKEIRRAAHVLMIMSPTYRRRFEDDGPTDTGLGVGWEARLIREALYADQRRGRDKFLVVLLPDGQVEDIPDLLQPWSGTRYHVRDFTLQGAEALIRLLTAQPAHIEHELRPPPLLPPIGPTRVVLRLDVSGGSAEMRAAVIDAATGVGRRGPVPPEALTADVDGALVVLDTTTAAAVVEPCLRRLLERVRTVARTDSRLQVRVGADVVDGTSISPTGEVAAQLARCAVARELHVLPGVHLVVVASTAYREWATGAAAYPGPESYREMPQDGTDGEARWFAVPGMNSCPRPPITTRASERRSPETAAPPGYWFPNPQGDVTIVTQGDHGHVEIRRGRGER